MAHTKHKSPFHVQYREMGFASFIIVYTIKNNLQACLSGNSDIHVGLAMLPFWDMSIF